MTVDEVMELDGIQMISSIIYHGIDVSIVPPRRCVPAPNPVAVREIELPGLEARQVGLLARHDNPRSDLVDALRIEMCKVVDTEQSGTSGK
ncbi:hypothetical protein NDI72_20985 (plasmid) [Nitratireductor sp. GZWM139]|nr:hypothetical protein [Nitratireductor sp. GZWM139]MDJ1466017.1 hypothetical protein [Nitratireductor sp. GZWM139]